MATRQLTLEQNIQDLLNSECVPPPRPQFVEALTKFSLGVNEAFQLLHQGPDRNDNSQQEFQQQQQSGLANSFLKAMSSFDDILSNAPHAAYECPLVMTSHVRKIADLSLAVGHRNRARVLLQIGNMFKLGAMSKWWNVVLEYKDRGEKAPEKYHRQVFRIKGKKELEKYHRFHPRMQIDYSMGLSVLTQELLESPRPLLLQSPFKLEDYKGLPNRIKNQIIDEANAKQASESESESGQESDQSESTQITYTHGQHKPRIDVLSICVYKPDDTSHTVLHSPLPKMSPVNHRQYVEYHQLNHENPDRDHYFLHTKLLTQPGVEAHYSKFLSVLQHMIEHPDTDWIFFVDCDAFITNFDISPWDLLETFVHRDREGKEIEPSLSLHSDHTDYPIQFFVAEDTGGINTGVFMIRNSQWSIDYLQRVMKSPFTTAWDQSMFFMEIINVTLFNDYNDDFHLPDQALFLHQSQFNAFVPPASVDWQAYEWQPGDFVRHFAGCPWQEKPCLDKMYDSLDYVGMEYGPDSHSVSQKTAKSMKFKNNVKTKSEDIEGLWYKNRVQYVEKEGRKKKWEGLDWDVVNR